MTRPQITVNITEAAPVASTPTDTGILFFVFAGTGGPAVPTPVISVAEATAAGVPAAIAAWIGDALTQGCSEVIVLRATAVDPTAVTAAEWATALALLQPSLGPGQVTIPGVSTSAAYTSLLAHVAANTQRVAILDIDAASTAAAAETAVAAIAASNGANQTAVVGPWVTFSGAGGATRTTPGSVVAAGLAARGDAATGTANNAPIFDQSRSAGAVTGALGVSATYSDADADALYDAGVNLIRVWGGVVTLTGWRSISTDATWHDFNIGRLAEQLTSGISALMGKYLGRQIDGKGLLFSEVAGDITNYLLGIYNNNGLYGDTPADAFDVTCDLTNNTADTIAAGEVHADVQATASTSAEQITINIVTGLA